MEEVADPEAEDAAETEKELDLRMKEFEELMDRRPFLVNEVLLRRNPNDVQEWEKRVALWGSDDEKVRDAPLRQSSRCCPFSDVGRSLTTKVSATYQEALKTINPRKATSGLHQLFVSYAKFFEEGGAAVAEEDKAEPDLPSARKVFERAIQVPFRRVDELAEVWIEWAEMEVRNE
jgi:pre-mRNA-splicing factor SYF1